MLYILKKKTVFIPVLLGVLVTVAFASRSGGKAPAGGTAVAERKNIVQEVTVSGTVKAKEAVVLGFEKTGKVRKINVEVGDEVEQGELLMLLENGVEASSVEDAEAKLVSQQAHYNDLKTGGSPEAVALKKTELAKAEADLKTDYSAVQNLVRDAFNKADNAVRRQADILFSNPSTNPKINFVSSNLQSKVDAESGRLDMEELLDSFKKLAQGNFETVTDNENALTETKKYLVVVNDFLIKVNRTLDASLNLSDTTLATDKDALNTARTNINTALTNVTEAAQAIVTQKITVETAQNELTLTQAPATTDVLNGALADVAAAEASVKNAQAVLAKTYILSPITGIVTKQDAKVGEIVGANTNLLAVASDNFKIEAFVPEVDLAKIVVGNEAAVTLDAYGNEVSFTARVTKIDPAETVVEGVPTYKTTLEFDKNDSRIRSGLTANITIATATRQGVLSIPNRAVFERNGKKFVRVQKGGGIGEEREVTVGIKGANGDMEIIKGLSENETVITSGQPK